jgi:hypothetical protein
MVARNTFGSVNLTSGALSAAVLLSIAAVMQHLVPCWAAARTDTGSSSSSSSSVADTPSQPAQQRHQQYLPLLVLVAQLRHWALVQVQLMQLVDSVGCKVQLMKTLLVMLDAAGTVGARLHTAVKQAACAAAAATTPAGCAWKPGGSCNQQQQECRCFRGCTSFHNQQQYHYRHSRL